MNFMEAILITVSSMAIVFLTLLIIAFILESFKYIFKNREIKVEKEMAPCEAAMTEEIDEEEKVVVALAASMIAGEGKINPNLRISKITRIK
ncbi:MAG: OadG family protein [Peptostreptococcaceae bacterium]